MAATDYPAVNSVLRELLSGARRTPVITWWRRWDPTQNADHASPGAMKEGTAPAPNMTEYGRESLWRDTATADAARARDLAARLERRAKAEDEVAARDIYLRLLDIASGEQVLDVGCGSGAVTREIARRVGRDGLAIGVDPSPALLAVARELAQESGVGDRVQFREGNALRLPFPDAAFDVVLCVTVLSQVPGAEAAIPGWYECCGREDVSGSSTSTPI
jgi:SAM-dependent methyltransferase